MIESRTGFLTINHLIGDNDIQFNSGLIISLYDPSRMIILNHDEAKLWLLHQEIGNIFYDGINITEQQSMKDDYALLELDCQQQQYHQIHDTLSSDEKWD